MNCPACGVEVYIGGKTGETNYYIPVNLKLRSYRDGFKIPFYCGVCGALKFNYVAVRDVLFVWPYPKPTESKGGIVLVDDNYIGGSYVEEIRPNKAIVLAIGDGFFSKTKKKFIPCYGIEVGDVVRYNKKVPWVIELKNDNEEKHKVTLCGFQDCYAVES